MKTPPTYRDLARSSTRITRRVQAEDLERMGELGTLLDAVTATFVFFQLDGKTAVRADASASVMLPCQWCEERVERELLVHCEALLAESEAQASEWAVESDELPVIAVVGKTFDAAALIEDELILAVPGRVCADSACPRRPSTSYGEVVPDTPGPLAGLRQLLDAKQHEK